MNAMGSSQFTRKEKTDRLSKRAAPVKKAENKADDPIR
jgi:hypothetical protein